MVKSLLALKAFAAPAGTSKTGSPASATVLPIEAATMPLEMAALPLPLIGGLPWRRAEVLKPRR
jgi:hypothetical protein